MPQVDSTAADGRGQSPVGAACDPVEWLEALHRRVCDRIQHQHTRELAAAHCRLELYLPNGWPAFRVAGRIPASRGWPDAVCTRYREALQSVLREMASKEALETAVQEQDDQPNLFAGMVR